MLSIHNTGELRERKTGTRKEKTKNKLDLINLKFFLSYFDLLIVFSEKDPEIAITPSLESYQNHRMLGCLLLLNENAKMSKNG